MRTCAGRNAKGAPCRAPENLVDEETGFCPSHAPSTGMAVRVVEAQAAELDGERYEGYCQLKPGPARLRG